MFANKLRELRNSKDLTQNDIAKLLGVTQQAIGLYETGKRQPDPEALEKLADFFGVTVGYLVGNAPDICIIKDKESHYFIEVKGKNKENLSAKELLDRYYYPIKDDGLIKVPILGTIRAGLPLYADQHIQGYEYVPANEAKNGEYFYLRVKGDSMIGARIQDGDLVYVRKQTMVDSGEIAVVLVNGEEATLKRVLMADDSIILQPENPRMRPMVYSLKDNDIKIIGKVLHVKFEAH